MASKAVLRPFRIGYHLPLKIGYFRGTMRAPKGLGGLELSLGKDLPHSRSYSGQGFITAPTVTRSVSG